MQPIIFNYKIFEILLCELLQILNTQQIIYSPELLSKVVDTMPLSDNNMLLHDMTDDLLNFLIRVEIGDGS